MAAAFRDPGPVTGNAPRVVLVTEYYAPQTGGLAAVAARSRALLQSLGCRVEVLWVSRDAFASDPAVSPFHPPIRFTGPWSRRMERSCAIRRRLMQMHREAPIDWVEFSNWNATAFATAVASPLPVVTRVSTSALQSDDVSALGWRDRLTRACLARMERRSVQASRLVIMNSETHAEQYSAALGLSPGDRKGFYVLPLAVDDPGASAGPRTPGGLLFVGRATWRKGVDLLDEIVARLVERRKGAGPLTLHLVGADPADLPRASRISPRSLRIVSHAGPGDAALSDLYRDASVVLMPSRYESFGLVTLEAMAHARPVVAFATGGTRDLIDHGETGWLARPFDLDAFADAAATMLDDAGRNRAIGDAARAAYLERYSPSAFAVRMTDLYRTRLDVDFPTGPVP